MAAHLRVFLGTGALASLFLWAASPAPAAAQGCTNLAAGVRVSQWYDETMPNGAVVRGARLEDVARPNGRLDATLQVTALPPGTSCVTLALASYRSTTRRMTPAGYQSKIDGSPVFDVPLGGRVHVFAQMPDQADGMFPYWQVDLVTGQDLAWIGRETYPNPDVRPGVRYGTQRLLASATGELPNPYAKYGTWEATSRMTQARTGATATLLRDGRVLVAGGRTIVRESNFTTVSWFTLATAEIYDPATGRWTRTGSLHEPRTGHTATLLPDGRVLVVGGTAPAIEPVGTPRTPAEIYDPDTGRWSSATMPYALRINHTATLLPDGRVLIAGGDIDVRPSPYADPLPTASAELFDPATGHWTATGSMTTPRAGHTATLLPNGQVLVAGGAGVRVGPGSQQFGPALDTAELYNPTTGTWTRTGSLARPRYLHAAVALPGGDVLIAYGFVTVPDDPVPVWESGYAERYNRSTGTWSPAGRVSSYGTLPTAVALRDGRALFVEAANWFTAEPDGYTLGDLYDPHTNTWTTVLGPHVDRTNATGTLLTDGRVLLTGGGISFGGMTDEAELFTPTSVPTTGGKASSRRNPLDSAASGA